MNDKHPNTSEVRTENLNTYRLPEGVMGGPCLNCSGSQPEHAGLTCDQVRAKRGREIREVMQRAHHGATVSQIKDHLATMIASAEVYTDADGNVLGYRVKTGALHKLIGLLGVPIPVNLPEVRL